MKAPRLERRRQAVIGNGEFVAPGPHGLKEIVESERPHQDGDRDKNRREHGDLSRGVAASLHEHEQPQRRQQEER